MTKASNRRSRATVSILTTVQFVGSQDLVAIPAAFATQPTTPELAIPRTPEVPVTGAPTQSHQIQTEPRYRYRSNPPTGFCVDPQLRRPDQPGIPPMPPEPGDPGDPKDPPIVIPPPPQDSREEAPAGPRVQRITKRKRGTRGSSAVTRGNSAVIGFSAKSTLTEKEEVSSESTLPSVENLPEPRAPLGWDTSSLIPSLSQIVREKKSRQRQKRSR